MTISPPLYLSAEEVYRALPMSDAIAAMRAAFSQLSSGQVTLPTRQRLDAPDEQGAALVMPCYSPTLKLFSLKLVTIYDKNPERGLPAIQALVLLTDGTTGSPLAILDGASLTALRTGAASGLATDLMARPESVSVAIIGAGVQARTQLAAVCSVRPIKRVRVFSRNPTSATRFASEMTERSGLIVEPVSSPTEALTGADVICTATGSTMPVFADCDVPPGAHINAIGSFRPEMIEIPAATICRARVVVDQRAAALEEAGDLLAPLRQGLIAEAHLSSELGEIVLGQSVGRTRSDEITVFKSVGVAIQDLYAGARALENARRLGIGSALRDAARTSAGSAAIAALQAT